MDQTYVGGQGHGKRGRGSLTKPPVVGIVQREDPVVARGTKDVTSRTMLSPADEVIDRAQGAMVTDESFSCNVFRRQY